MFVKFARWAFASSADGIAAPIELNDPGCKSTNCGTLKPAPGGIAARVAEAQSVECRRLVRWRWRDVVDLGREVMAGRKVEAHRTAAATAMVAVAAAQLGNALQRLLLTLELPGIEIPIEGGVSLHGRT